MLRTLALLRHGLASGQAPAAELLPEGATYLRRLAALLDRESWRPGAIATSPYRRARESAAVVAAALRVNAPLFVLEELMPEGEPDDALAAVLAAAPSAATILVVSHLPLIGRLAQRLVEDDPGFSPGTLVEIERADGGPARLLRRVSASDLPDA